MFIPVPGRGLGETASTKSSLKPTFSPLTVLLFFGGGALLLGLLGAGINYREERRMRPSRDIQRSRSDEIDDSDDADDTDEETFEEFMKRIRKEE